MSGIITGGLGGGGLITQGWTGSSQTVLPPETLFGRSGCAALIVATWLQNENVIQNPEELDLAVQNQLTFWPYYVGSLQDDFSEAVCFYDTGAIPQGRIPNGITIFHEDIQVRVRANSYVGAQRKTNEIMDYIDQMSTNKVVAVQDGTEEQAKQYIINAISLRGAAFYIGPDEKQRPSFTVNARCAIRPKV